MVILYSRKFDIIKYIGRITVILSNFPINRNFMNYIRVKQKYQLTIPTIVRKMINIHEGDTLKVEVKNGYIILVPQVIVDKNINNHKVKSPLISMIGANKNSGLYKSVQDIDKTIAKQRDEWN